MKNTLHFCKVLTIENLLLSSDIHRLYLIKTPQIILLQFLKIVDVICPKVIFQGQKTGSFCTEKPPFFCPQTTTSCGFTLISRLSTTTCHQYHRFHMARYVHFDVRASRRSRKQIQPISSEKIEICLVRFKSISSREHIHYFRKPA